MEKWVKLMGLGRFTCGMKYICFIPEASNDYMPIAERPAMMDEKHWSAFAESLTAYLNEKRR